MHSRSMSFSVILSKFFKIYDSFGSKTWNNCTMSLLERYDLQKVDSRARQKRLLLASCVISRRIIPYSMVYDVVSMCNQIYFL
jgi:hypothetical protein